MKSEEIIGRLEEIRDLLYKEGYHEHLYLKSVIDGFKEYDKEMQEDR